MQWSIKAHFEELNILRDVIRALGSVKAPPFCKSIRFYKGSNGFGAIISYFKESMVFVPCYFDDVTL